MEGTTREHDEPDGDEWRQIGWYSPKFDTFHHSWHGEHDIPAYVRVKDENSKNQS